MTTESKALASLSAVCSCCGREIKKIVIIDGKPFGVTCAKDKQGDAVGKAETFVKINVASFRLFADTITADQAENAARHVDAFVVGKDGRKYNLRVVFSGRYANIFKQGNDFYVSTKAFDLWKTDKGICQYLIANKIRFVDFFTAS